MDEHRTQHLGLCPKMADLESRLVEQMEIVIEQLDKNENRFKHIEESLDRLENLKAQATGGYKLFMWLVTILGVIAAILAVPSWWPWSGQR